MKVRNKFSNNKAYSNNYEGEEDIGCSSNRNKLNFRKGSTTSLADMLSEVKY
jgi:hypothetical protein